MINFLNNWIEQITISVIIVSIFELILPKGNIKKYIKVVLGIYIIFCMISPFVDSFALYDLQDFDVSKYVENDTSSNLNQQSMDSRLQELYIDELKKDISKKVEENGYSVLKCDIEAVLDKEAKNPGIHNIKLNITQKGIGKVETIEIGNTKKEETKEEQNVKKIKKELADFYEISESIIEIKIK